mmetsp:Transcript_7029/g.8095  ORF Transcript_7029/g.8095 Transcript_7029/m.8095 type:complete len:538 (-) Transcript_7029:473-2086(-)
MKITDKLKALQEEEKAFFSLEFFPPRTDRAQKNLLVRIENLSEIDPLFVSVTCSNGRHDITLNICKLAHKFSGVEVLMHITCVGRSREEVRKILEEARAAGISNVLVLRGDSPTGKENYSQDHPEQFQNATELVRYTRKEFGDYFCIGVTGYPEGRLDYQSELKFLKEKVECGADFIITQVFFDAEAFFRFENDCKGVGINIPIIPGIFPIQGYTQFKKVTNYLRVQVPDRILQGLEPIKSDDEKVKHFGVQIAVDMCRRVLQNGTSTKGVHLYTLNLETSVRSIVNELDNVLKVSERYRPLPWKPSVENKRSSEDVRPIFWANRPKSYVARTEEWDEFPNGRWGEKASPAFRDVDDSHFYMRGALFGDSNARKKAWGQAPISEEDVFQVFVDYIEGKVKFLPWCETPLHFETNFIKDKLVEINRNGFLTINSQPRVNGAMSTEKPFGWGPPNGFVYQKAYIEFFTSPKNLEKLMNACKEKKFSSLTYHAINVNGESHTNCKTQKPCAVSWPTSAIYTSRLSHFALVTLGYVGGISG